jgi:hypothetical protein
MIYIQEFWPGGAIGEDWGLHEDRATPDGCY